MCWFDSDISIQTGRKRWLKWQACSAPKWQQLFCLLQTLRVCLFSHESRRGTAEPWTSEIVFVYTIFISFPPHHPIHPMRIIFNECSGRMRERKKSRKNHWIESKGVWWYFLGWQTMAKQHEKTGSIIELFSNTKLPLFGLIAIFCATWQGGFNLFRYRAKVSWKRGGRQFLILAVFKLCDTSLYDTPP